MRIFITGGSGFVGQHVSSELINHDAEILCLLLNDEEKAGLPEGVKTVTADLSNVQAYAKSLQEFNPEACLHLAWQGIPDYSEAISKLNLLNSISLFDFLANRTTCKKIIVSGSCFEYGKDRGAQKESQKTRTNSFFAWAKKALYEYASLLCKKNGINLIWMRIFYVYGPNQREGSLIPSLINSFEKGITPDIKNPFNSNDFVYVEDIAKAFAAATQKVIPSGIYNLGSGEATSVLDVCGITEKLITGKTDVTTAIKNNSKAKQKTNFRADTNKSEKILGWKAKTSLRDGMQKHISSIEGNK